jgi:hypothetical protein
MMTGTKPKYGSPEALKYTVSLHEAKKASNKRTFFLRRPLYPIGNSISSVIFSGDDDSFPFIGALRRWFDRQTFLECERHGVAERIRKGELR